MKKLVCLIPFGLLVVLGLVFLFAREEKETKRAEDYYSGQYVKEVFKKDRVGKIEITMDAKDYQDLKENPLEKNYYSCQLNFGKLHLKNVGIRTKGNTSLEHVVKEGGEKYSLKLEFDHYQKGQTLYGLDKLCLNNGYQDPGNLREYTAYSVFEKMGAQTPLFSYFQLVINGENMGLYLGVEGIEEAFLKRTTGSISGNLYKPEEALDGKYLEYIDGNPDSYPAIFNASVFGNESQADKEKLVACLKALSLEENLEDTWDLSQVIPYLAASSFVVNDDSYVGNMFHNYYLSYKDGKASIFPWDYNYAFGKFDAQVPLLHAKRSVDSPIANGGTKKKVLVYQVISKEDLREEYHKLLLQTAKCQVEEEGISKFLDEAEAVLLKESLCDQEELETAKEEIKEFIVARSESILTQLQSE